MAKEIENDLSIFSVASPTSAFGVVRKEGSIVYDRTNNVSYFLTADATPASALGTFTSKTQM